MFGLAEYDLGDRLTVSVEGRYQQDDRDFLFRRVDAVPVPTNTSLGPATDNLHYGKFSPTGSIRFRLDDDNIVYGRVATAFRPGGFNTGTINPGFLSYEPESTLGAEVGWKGRLFGRFDAALAGYTNWSDDVQVVTTVSVTDTTAAIVNVPGTFNWGVEAEVSAAFEVGPGTLFLQSAVSTADGDFDAGSNVIVNAVNYNISDTRINRARDLTAVLNARYSVPVTSDLSLFGLVTFQTESGGYENAIGQLKIPGQSRSLDDFSNVDLRFGADFRRVRASIFVQNVGDEPELLQTIQGNEYYGNARIIGGEITLKFGE